MSVQSCDCSSLLPRSMCPFDERNIMILLGVGESCHKPPRRRLPFPQEKKIFARGNPKNILNQNKNKANVWLVEVMLE